MTEANPQGNTPRKKMTPKIQAIKGLDSDLSTIVKLRKNKGMTPAMKTKVISEQLVQLLEENKKKKETASSVAEYESLQLKSSKLKSELEKVQSARKSIDGASYITRLPTIHSTFDQKRSSLRNRADIMQELC